MVSVIVPVWNDASALDRLLSRITREPGVSEIVVADGGSTDETIAVVEARSSVRLTETVRGRGRQMNAGAAKARGDVLLFLHADTLPPSGAIAELPGLLEERGADFGAFRVGFDPPVWLPQTLSWLTRFAFHWTCFGDQGIFVRREFFERTGGYPEVPLLEDVHWLRRAAKSGCMVRSRQRVVTSARRFLDVGTVRQTWRNFSILIRNHLGQDPETLAALYRRGPDEEAPQKTPERVFKAEPVKLERG